MHGEVGYHLHRLLALLNIQDDGSQSQASTMTNHIYIQL